MQLTACCDLHSFFPSSFIFPAQRLQVPAECRRAYNVSVLHLSPLLSDDRRSYTYKQSDTHTRCVYHRQTTEFVCFGNKSLRISTSHPVMKMNMSSKAKLRSKTRLGAFFFYIPLVLISCCQLIQPEQVHLSSLLHGKATD